MASATTKITGKESKQVSSKANWTFMVFMAGDNNLDGAALRDITEMAQAGSTAEVNIIAQLDRAGGGSHLAVFHGKGHSGHACRDVSRTGWYCFYQG
jgi:hypothetical protein